MPSSQQLGICCAVFSVNEHLLDIWGNVFEELKSPSSLGQQHAGACRPTAWLQEAACQGGMGELRPAARWA